MKKVLLIGILLVGLTSMAQERKGHADFRYYRDLTPEQAATLSSKRLALALDLTEGQREKVMALHLKRAEEQKTVNQPGKEDRASGGANNDEKFNRMNAALDRQLAYKNAMKDILSEAQYKKWEHLHRPGKMPFKKRHHHSYGERR